MSVSTIHHMAATGGTIISKAVAAASNAILLSEINPFFPSRKTELRGGFRPAALVEQAIIGSQDLSLPLKEKWFLVQLDLVLEHGREVGRPIFIRDHSHSSFKIDSGRSNFLDLFARREIKIRPILSVRHPLDSFISASPKGWHRVLAPKTGKVDEYCLSMIKFVEALRQIEHTMLIRYEDFCRNPERQVAEMCSHLELDFDPAGLESVMDVPASGLSGRKSERIEPRARQAVNEEIRHSLIGAENYERFCKMFEYNTDVDASPV